MKLYEEVYSVSGDTLIKDIRTATCIYSYSAMLFCWRVGWIWISRWRLDCRRLFLILTQTPGFRFHSCYWFRIHCLTTNKATAEESLTSPPFFFIRGEDGGMPTDGRWAVMTNLLATFFASANFWPSPTLTLRHDTNIQPHVMVKRNTPK